MGSIKDDFSIFFLLVHKNLLYVLVRIAFVRQAEQTLTTLVLVKKYGHEKLADYRKS